MIRWGMCRPGGPSAHGGNELRGEKIDIVPLPTIRRLRAKALSPAKIKEVSSIGDRCRRVMCPTISSPWPRKGGQIARLSARLDGLANRHQELDPVGPRAAYAETDWTEGEWVVKRNDCEQVWRPAEEDRLSAEDRTAEGSEDALLEE